MEVRGSRHDHIHVRDRPAGKEGQQDSKQDVTLARGRPRLWAGLLGWGVSPQAVAADDDAAAPSPDVPDAVGASEPEAPDEPRLPSFSALPEHLLQKVFSYLEGSSRRHHFNV